MTKNIWIEGIELVRIAQLWQEKLRKPSPQDQRQYNRAVKELKSRGIGGVMYDSEGYLTSDQGAVYALHGCGYVTQERIDSCYPMAASRKIG